MFALAKALTRPPFPIPGLAAVAVALLVSAPAPAGAGEDRPFVLEVVQLGAQKGFRASCDVTDGLGITRSSTFESDADGTARFIGTQVSCALHGSGEGLMQVTLRSGQAILVRVEGAANQPIAVVAN